MRYVYEIIYTPFENNDKGYPWLYSGSDYHARPSYYGSPSSKKVFSYTEGLSLCNWWKKELRSNPHHFKKVILVELSDNVNRKELLSLESAIQKKENHAGDVRYFNFTNKNYNTPLTNNPHKGIPLEKVLGKEAAESANKKRSDAMKEIRKRKTWSTKDCVDTEKLSNAVTSTWESRSKEERSIIGKKSAKTRKENGNNPKPGCWKGKNPNENKRWFTNGIVAIYINITKQIPPEGFYPGRKIKC